MVEMNAFLHIYSKFSDFSQWYPCRVFLKLQRLTARDPPPYPFVLVTEGLSCFTSKSREGD